MVLPIYETLPPLPPSAMCHTLQHQQEKKEIRIVQSHLYTIADDPETLFPNNRTNPLYKSILTIRPHISSDSCDSIATFGFRQLPNCLFKQKIKKNITRLKSVSSSTTVTENNKETRLILLVHMTTSVRPIKDSANLRKT